MADQQSSRGRARGRGRGQQQQQATPVQQMAQLTLGSSPTQEGGNGNGGNGAGAAMRGRGGYRAFDPVTRPATASVGNKGQQIRLIANYFKMQTNPNLTVYQYHVTFNPPEIERKFKRQAIRTQAELFNNAYIYDGDATLFVLNDAGDEHEFVEQLP
ncbi:piwi-like protein 1, partial [Leptotrombidium deliense]